MQPVNRKSRFVTVLKDPAFISLLVINGMLMVLYRRDIDNASTILFTYYLQSVIIGILHFIRLLKLKGSGWPVAGFFAIHYGLFHFVYLIFLGPMLTEIPGNVEMPLLGASVIGFLGGGIAELIEKRARDQKIPPVPGLLFFQPYLRIVPVHLFIMSAFLDFAPEKFLFFLVLKTGADLLTYILFKKPAEQTVIA
ncbi:MAG TPA: DUF6498-containing protein [Bacteroidia bacterium]|nr:DUF6498-containing protein [Bacteroidia bacterium]